MLIVTLRIDAPAGHAIGAKEAIAQDLEKYGDVRVVSVVEELPEQLRMQAAGPSDRAASSARTSAPSGIFL